jgi:putative spermidine/putrescine transport system permease protein
MSAALQNFDWAQLEAAADLGARPLRSFIKVVLPQVSAGAFFAGLLAFIFSFDQVETTLFLVRPGEATLPIEMFLYLQRAQDPTIAALSSCLILFSIGLLGLAAVVFRRRKPPVPEGR